MLNSEEIFHIAQLAKLEINEQEAEKYKPRTLGYFGVC